jgi:hypothetical protein
MAHRSRIRIAALALTAGALASACSAPPGDTSEQLHTTPTAGEPAREVARAQNGVPLCPSCAPVIGDQHAHVAPGWSRACATRSFFVRPADDRGCADLAARGGTWRGVTMWPGTSSPFCKYTWAGRDDVAIDFEALDVSAELLDDGEADVRAECTAHASACGVDDGACEDAARAAAPDHAAGRRTYNGVPPCPGCGVVIHDRIHVILPPPFVNAQALLLTSPSSTFAFTPPRDAQVFTVPLDAPFPPDGTLVDLDIAR